MVTRPDAVVFDCDGTLADTEPLADRAWSATLADRGYEATEEDFAAVIGHPFRQNVDYFSRKVDLGDLDRLQRDLRARFEALLDTELRLHDDAAHVLRDLVAAGVPVGVASSSRHAHVLRVLRAGGLEALVGVVVGADDVARHKPHPEPYLEAARALGIPPSRCVAVEDTEVGITSAVAAGMFTVGIVRPGTHHGRLAAAHRVVEWITTSALSPPGGHPA